MAELDHADKRDFRSNIELKKDFEQNRKMLAAVCLFIIIAAVSLSAASANTTAYAPRLLQCQDYGDYNSDGYLTMDDATGCSNQMSIGYLQRCDVNANRRLDFADVTAIYNYMNGANDTFPACKIAAKRPPCRSYGDYNGDGYVKTEDYNGCFEQVGVTYLQNCDVNGNGRLDFADIVSIYNYMNGVITTFPACNAQRKQPPCGQYGDYNKDGYVTMEDTLGCFNQVGGDYIQRCDVNANGRLDFADVVSVYNYANSLIITTFPACKATCSDTDGGVGYNRKGTIVSQNLGNKTDTCKDAWNLTEYYCNSNIGYSLDYRCSNGCISGACNTATKKSPCGDYGDYNSDGYVTMDDATGCSNQMSIGYMQRCDVNANRRLDFADITAIHNYIKGAITTFTACNAQRKQPPCGSYGDYNNDGYLTTEDYNGCFNQVGETYMQRCDVNANGRLDFADVTAIYNYMNGVIRIFQACNTTTTTTITTQTTTQSTAGTTTATTSTTTTTLAKRPPCRQYGDYNSDGYVTMDDVTGCFNQVGETYMQRCDVNGNQRLDFADVTAIYNYMNGATKTFQACNTTTTTLACVPEGGFATVSPGAPTCCAGLGVAHMVPEGDKCVMLVGGIPCTKCGNGICGPQENRCNCPKDCSGNTTTTTTTRPTTTTTFPVTCTDTDGGLNINVKGTVRLTDQRGTSTYTDDCYTNNTLREYTCSTHGTVDVWTPICPGQCRDGACVTTTTTTTTTLAKRRPPCGNYGDYNGDGYVTEEDTNGCFEKVGIEEVQNCEVNGNGRLDFNDVVLIHNYAAGGATFPVCGTTTTIKATTSRPVTTTFSTTRHIPTSIATTTTTTTTLTGRPIPCGQYGDYNKDGRITEEDATKLFWDIDIVTDRNMDVNDNGFIDWDDATIINQYAIGNINTFPVCE